ncbi:MAG: DUF5683 domain-containing protein [Bacteroidia bacterium]|nr:DUF5683 domain-containing protein [Bacteroidia bacterium]
MGVVRNRLNWLALSILLILTPGLSDFAPAQNNTDSIASGHKTAKTIHSASKATILAAIIPGAGQAYNRKYWKIPVAYVGYSFIGYRLLTNQKNYKYSKDNYLALTDTLESTVNQSGKSAAELLANIDGYRRLRDLSVILLLAWHGLTIIDANVDANLFNWDVSEDLSLRIRPIALWVGRMSPGVGLSFVLNSK